MANKTGMLASRTPDRWGQSRHHFRPTGTYRKVQKRARRRAERNLWRQDFFA